MKPVYYTDGSISREMEPEEMTDHHHPDAQALLDCPFCRGSSKIYVTWHKDLKNPERHYTPLCKDGKCFGHQRHNWFLSEKDAITAWNTRAASPSIPEGFALVPIEPTEAMWDAGRDPIMFRDLGYFRPHDHAIPAWQIGPDGKVERDESKGTTAVHVWRAMIAAAPQPKEIK